MAYQNKIVGNNVNNLKAVWRNTHNGNVFYMDEKDLRDTIDCCHKSKTADHKSALADMQLKKTDLQARQS